MYHERAKYIGIGDQLGSFFLGNAFALSKGIECVDIFFFVGRCCGIFNGYIVEVQTKGFDAGFDLRFGTDQNGVGKAFVAQNLTGLQNAVLFAFGKYYAFGIGFGFVHGGANDFP